MEIGLLLILAFECNHDFENGVDKSLITCVNATRELQEKEARPRTIRILFTIVQEIQLDLFGYTAIGAWFQRWNHILAVQTPEFAITITRTESFHTIGACIWGIEYFVTVATHLIGRQKAGFALFRTEEPQNIFNAFAVNAQIDDANACIASPANTTNIRFDECGETENVTQFHRVPT